MSNALPAAPPGAALVSVVLPTYNRAATLAASARSVLDQTYRDLELIVVDDGSTDDTEAVVRGFSDARVRYVRRAKGGPGAARNTGIAEARGGWIAFQDSDDIWLPEKLARQMEAAHSAPPDTGVILCGHRDLRPERTYERGVDDPMTRGDAHASLIAGLYYITPTWLVRASALARAGGFDESLPSCEDHDLAFRLSDTCRFQVVPEVLVVKHYRDDSVYNHPTSRTEGFRRVLERHRARWDRSPYWLARHELMLGYWLLNERRRRWLAYRYLWRAARHHPATARQFFLMDLYHNLPAWLREALCRVPFVLKFLINFEIKPPSMLPRRPVARLFTIVPLDPNFPNGFSARWYHFVRALADKFDVEVVAVRGIWHERTLPDDAFRPPMALKNFRVADALAMPRIPSVLLFRLALLLSNFNMRRFGPRLQNVEVAMSPPPDLAIFCTHYLSHLASMYADDVACLFLLEEGMVRTLHTNLPPIARRQLHRRLWRKIMQFLSELRYDKVVARCGPRGPIVAISAAEGAWLRERIPQGDIHVVANGLDPADFEPLPPRPDHDVAVFGDLQQARNFVPTARLIKRALQRDDTRHWRWLLVGREPDVSLRKLPQDRVTLTGTVDDTRPFYPRASVVVVPARMVTGSKSTILKAWAMQRPVVTTPFGTVGLPVRPGVNVLVGDTDDEVLDRIAELLAAPARADALAAAGRRTLMTECNQNRQAEEFATLCLRTVHAHRAAAADMPPAA